MKTPEEKKITPACAYCTYGTSPLKSGDKTSSPFSEAVWKSECRKRAESRGKTACFRFRYDPLLRVPKPPRVLPEHSKGEFEL